MMSHQLTEYDKKILAALDTRGAFTTSQVAAKVAPMFGHNKRTHSGAVRSWLLRLEAAGLVKRLDNQKPVCWLLAKLTHSQEKKNGK
jgi:phage head maturation protease